MDNERKYIAVSIKHSNSLNNLVLWGTRTKDAENRCFSGYSDFIRRDGRKCELYSLEEFRSRYGNGVCKTDEAVRLTDELLRDYKKYDTVMISEKEYMDFFGIVLD